MKKLPSDALPTKKGDERKSAVSVTLETLNFHALQILLVTSVAEELKMKSVAKKYVAMATRKWDSW